jgi:hypothetical protein
MLAAFRCMSPSICFDPWRTSDVRPSVTSRTSRFCSSRQCARRRGCFRVCFHQIHLQFFFAVVPQPSKSLPVQKGRPPFRVVTCAQALASGFAIAARAGCPGMGTRPRSSPAWESFRGAASSVDGAPKFKGYTLLNISGFLSSGIGFPISAFLSSSLIT